MRERLPLRGREVVEPAGHDALRVEPTARLEVGDRLPAAQGVGGEVADRVEQARAVLAVHVRARAHVLADQRADLGVLEIRDRRRREHRAARDVVQVAHHQVVVGGAVVLGGVRVELVRERGSLGRDAAVRDGRLEPGAQDRRVDDHLRDLLADVRLPGEAVRFGDELCEAHELVRLLDERREPAEPLPQAERVREHRRVMRLAVEEHALVRNEHVVEDHEALRHVVPARDRERAQVAVARRIGGVHDAHARRGDRHHRGDRVRLLARLHRLRRDGHQVVGVGRARDVELRAADHDTVRVAVHHAHVQVGIVLLGGRQRAVALRVGDALDDAEVFLLRAIDVVADALDVGRAVAHARGRRHQRHDRLVRDVRDQIRLVQHGDARAEILGRARDGHQRARSKGLGREEAVVGRRDLVDRRTEHGVALEVVDALALEVGRAAVSERGSILGAGLHVTRPSRTLPRPGARCGCTSRACRASP